MIYTILHDTHSAWFVKFAGNAITFTWVNHLFSYSHLKILIKNFTHSTCLYFVIELNKNTRKIYHLDCEVSEMEKIAQSGKCSMFHSTVQRSTISIMLSNIETKIGTTNPM